MKKKILLLTLGLGLVFSTTAFAKTDSVGAGGWYSGSYCYCGSGGYRHYTAGSSSIIRIYDILNI